MVMLGSTPKKTTTSKYALGATGGVAARPGPSLGSMFSPTTMSNLGFGSSLGGGGYLLGATGGVPRSQSWTPPTVETGNRASLSPYTPALGALGAYSGGGGMSGGASRLPPAQPSGGGGGGGGGIQFAMNWKDVMMRAEAIRKRGEMGKMFGRWGAEQAEAKSANERRYQQMLGIAAKTTGQRGIDIRADYAQREASAMQQLTRQGMRGTTVAPTLGMGFEREKSSALDRLADLMQQTKLGIMERRTDAYPDLGAYMAAGQMMA